MERVLSSKIVILMLVFSVTILYSIPTATSELRNETVEGYLYRLVLETTSDWTTVDILGGPLVAGYNYTLTQGLDAPDLRYTISPNFIWIGKRAFDTTLVRMDVEVIALRGGDARIVIRKGDIGSTKLLIYVWRGGGYSLLYSVVNEGVNPQYPGTNDRSFYIDLEQLYKHPIASVLYQPTPAEFEKCVLASYYPWYGTPHGASRKWFHWEGVSEDSIANSAHYPLLGIYDSQDERLIEAHILLAKYSGIDGFVVSWWGINSFEGRSLEKLIKVAEKHDFKVTIYYESYRPWNPLTNIDQIVNELSYVITKYSNSPAFLKVNGKPVIFIYAIESHERGPEFWLKLRRSLEKEVGETYLIGDTRSPSYLHVFDGFHTYIELNREAMKNTYIFYNTSMRVGLAGQNFTESTVAIMSGNPINIQEKTLFYTVVPGYDDRKVRSPGNYLDRMNGETYRRFWEDALSSRARCILITSWNELHEGTEIEPTREYGFLFLNITRRYASVLKQESIIDVSVPQADIRFSLNEETNELLIRIVNLGKGPLIAAKIQILYTPGIEAHVVDAYRQPSKKESTVVIIPIINGQEEYTLSLKFKDLPRDKITMKINYYSTIGTSYATEASIVPIWKTTTKTLTTTLTVTTTSTTISTEKITETYILTTITPEIVIPESVMFALFGLIVMVIVLSAVLGYILKKETKSNNRPRTLDSFSKLP